MLQYNVQPTAVLIIIVRGDALRRWNVGERIAFDRANNYRASRRAVGSIFFKDLLESFVWEMYFYATGHESLAVRCGVISCPCFFAVAK